MCFMCNGLRVACVGDVFGLAFVLVVAGNAGRVGCATKGSCATSAGASCVSCESGAMREKRRARSFMDFVGCNFFFFFFATTDG